MTYLMIPFPVSDS